ARDDELVGPRGVDMDHLTGGFGAVRPGGTLGAAVNSTATAQRLVPARPGSAALLDAGIAAAALVGSLAVRTPRLDASRHGSGLDLAGILLVAASVGPLAVSRYAPFAVFVVTAAVSAAVAGLGYALDIPLGPTAALYLLATSRSDVTWWSPRI